MSTLHFHLTQHTSINHPINSTLLMATVWTINHLYVGYTNTLSFSLWSRTADDDIFHIQLLGDILTSTRDSQLIYVIEMAENIHCHGQQLLGDDIMTKKCLVHKDVIVIIDSFESFMRFKKELAKENYLVRGFYTIIYTGNKQTYYNVIYRIFDELFRVFMTNVNIYVEVLDETLVYTFFPFTKFHCRGSYPILLNRFTRKDGFIFQKSFFPNKVENFYGCPLTVSTWDGPPFIFFERKQNGEPNVYGIEGDLLQMLAVKMNFKLEFIETDIRGRIFPNLTSADYGAVKHVMDGTANITINSFGYQEFHLKAMLASYTYANYDIVVAIPQGQPLSSFQRLTKPFKYIIWSCLCTSVLKVKDFVFGPLNTIPFTNLVNVFFGGPVTVLPFARYILLIWLLYTMVLRNAYSGELYMMLQDSSSTTTLKNVEEMVSKNYTFWCADNTIEVVLKSTNSKLLEVFRGFPFRYLSKLREENIKIGVVIFKPYVRIYNRIFHPIPLIQTLPNKLLSAPLTMYLQRNSYLLDEINNHLMDIVAAGMLQGWDSFYLRSFEENVIEKEPAVLSVELLLGLFCAYFFLFGLFVVGFYFGIIVENITDMSKCFYNMRGLESGVVNFKGSEVLRKLQSKAFKC
ncbi:uncharacterized protein LOC129909678 [Episyrphus balteatus]|uniref:uncharacterized protein LOC129909678 n=1 Tax=Episyrphus balteatus TaxID=286459 RepID=UPI0024858206|nr:uncharacterized protein LOC129909678 [Episyrphus balteatus]